LSFIDPRLPALSRYNVETRIQPCAKIPVVKDRGIGSIGHCNHKCFWFPIMQILAVFGLIGTCRFLIYPWHLTGKIDQQEIGLSSPGCAGVID
jgi:hypothetical protein